MVGRLEEKLANSLRLGEKLATSLYVNQCLVQVRHVTSGARGYINELGVPSASVWVRLVKYRSPARAHIGSPRYIELNPPDVGESATP